MQNSIKQNAYFLATDCCESQVVFPETIPASPFHRQTESPAFYVR